MPFIGIFVPPCTWQLLKIHNKWPICHGSLSRMATQIAKKKTELWAKFSQCSGLGMWKAPCKQSILPRNSVACGRFWMGKESNPRKSFWLFYIIPKLNSNLQNYTFPQLYLWLLWPSLQPPMNHNQQSTTASFAVTDVFFRLPGHINAIGGKVAPSHRSQMHVPCILTSRAATVEIYHPNYMFFFSEMTLSHPETLL